MKKILQSLFKQSQKNSLAHAYLMVGNFDPAPIFDALKINFADQYEINAEHGEPVKIGQIRDLIHWIQLKPHSSKYKMAVIRKTETMTSEAANSILKVLEEPPANSIIFLQTEKTERIIPTILSRCQVFKISPTQGSDTSVCSDFLEVEKITKMSIRERFDYAAELSNSPNLVSILNSWEYYFREKLLEGQDTRSLIKEISAKRDLLLTNSSVKLLLENLLVKF